MKGALVTKADFRIGIGSKSCSAVPRSFEVSLAYKTKSNKKKRISWVFVVYENLSMARQACKRLRRDNFYLIWHHFTLLEASKGFRGMPLSSISAFAILFMLPVGSTCDMIFGFEMLLSKALRILKASKILKALSPEAAFLLSRIRSRHVCARLASE